MGGGDPFDEVRAKASQNIRPGLRDAAIKLEFIRYLTDHPELRFWQALRNWSDHNFIIVSDTADITKADELLKGAKAEDTFYWENRK